MTMITTSASGHGPLFDGRAARAAAAFAEDAERHVAQRGVNVVRVELDRVLRHPTGRYRGSVVTDRQRGDSVVTDGGVVYGPWLAGVGSRNRTTRFKGYAHWRRATAALGAQSGDVARSVLRRWIGRMGG